MTQPVVELFFSLSSPWAHLGLTKFRAIVARHGAGVVLHPIVVVQENGGIPLRSRPQPRQDYHETELDRWRHYLGLKLNLRPKHYPTDPRPAARMVIAGMQSGASVDTLLDFSQSVLAAIWADERDILDPDVRIELANRHGLNGKALLAAAESAEVFADWKTHERQAIASGVFGTPTFIFEGERFWGQDRLDFLDRTIDQWRQSLAQIHSGFELPSGSAGRA